MTHLKLSICIPTMNRGHIIGETLASIVPQMSEAVELVIVDGGGKDNTREVVEQYTAQCDRIRYFQGGGTEFPSNEGFDRDCDRSVIEARGEYCWLFTDDDYIAPGGIQAVLEEIGDSQIDLLLVDSEVRNLSMTKVLDSSRLALSESRDYRPDERDAFMADAGQLLTFVGGVVIRRRAWLGRERERYYGIGFLHVCVIFQEPSLNRIRILKEPIAQIRIGNAAWSARAFDIWMDGWPELIWSFSGYSDEAKRSVVAREPWRASIELLNYRALASLQPRHLKWLKERGAARSSRMFARLLLALPGEVAHVALSAMIAVSRMRRSSHAYTLLVATRFSNPLSRVIARINGHRVEG